MKFRFLLLLTMASMSFGQQYEFARDGRSYRLVEKFISTPLVAPDTRPLWKRLLYSIRPWSTAAPHTRLGYQFIDDRLIFSLDGQVGAGLQAKVEF